jgi:aminoglycoside 6'-N-acetyltransferase
MSAVHLATFDPNRDLLRIAEWLMRPHVARWWGDPVATLAAFERIDSSNVALIEIDDRPIGLVCWQTPTLQELAEAGLGDLPVDLVDLDILIGEPDALGKGHGPAALAHVLEALRDRGVRVVGLATETVNDRALRAFEKAGFRPFRDFAEAGREMRYLIRDL